MGFDVQNNMIYRGLLKNEFFSSGIWKLKIVH
jgi:hypothetical protein